MDETTTRPITLRAGDTVKVNLDVHMSSGASWQLVGDPPDNLEFLGSKVVQPQTQAQSDSPGRVGQREIQVFRFKALSKGNARLEFKKARPWEKQNTDKTFSVQLEVAAE
ncbi:MAG: protease inhibitor I42 family protein [Cystobacter sp.]